MKKTKKIFIINNAQREKAKAFLRMHQTEGMCVIPNAWDAASAYIYEKAGFAAVATTSAGTGPEYLLGGIDLWQKCCVYFGRRERDLCDFPRLWQDPRCAA